MSETLQIVMAGEDEALRPRGETVDFEPGLFALRILGGAILGNASPASDADSGLLLVASPPDPAHDEGIFLYRLADPVVQTLASWTHDGRRAAAEEWSTLLSRFHAPRGGLAKLAPPLIELADLAKRAVEAGRPLFVRRLER